MFNYCGIIYYCFCRIITGVILAIIPCSIKLFKNFKNKKEDTRNSTILMIAVMLFFSLCIGGYIWKCFNPRIESHEGYFWSEHNANTPGIPFNWKFSFSNKGEPRPTFYLDSFSRKKIFNEDFSQNARYRIYYDKHTKVIVHVEVLYAG